MPTPDEILAGLTAIANDALLVAIVWHGVVLATVGALLAGWRPSGRAAAVALLSLPVSVAVFAFSYGNPFNGLAFVGLTALLAHAGRRVPPVPTRRSHPRNAAAGAIVLAYAWVYPHFLEGQPLALYAIGAPLGLVPCPTLAAVTGFTLLIDGQLSRRWTIILAAFGLFYALFGVLRLGVLLDLGLLIGVLILIVESPSAARPRPGTARAPE